jgi:hypothetical protein
VTWGKSVSGRPCAPGGAICHPNRNVYFCLLRDLRSRPQFDYPEANAYVRTASPTEDKMPQSSSTPLLLDWTFWTALVAVIALVLSQLPPILTLLRRARIEVEAYSRMHLTHKIGNPNAKLHLIVTNVGGRSIKVKGMSLSFKRDGKEIAILPAQGYFQKLTDTSSVLFRGFTIKPHDEWAYTVWFLNFFNRTDEKRYRDAEAILTKDILRKRKLKGNKDRMVEADSKNVAVFLEMFEDKFVWLPGEYELRVSIVCSDKTANITTAYRFTLFESDSNALSSSKNDFKFGDGIYWDSTHHPGVYVQIVES